jgi:3-hydroxyisobutyrate dehydrogenase
MSSRPGALRSLAVLGTGAMGLPMARNLARAGLDVSAWNRTVDRARPLQDDGVRVTADAADAVREADAIVTMLSDTDAVLETMEAALGDGGSGAIWIQASTLGLDGIESCAEFAERHGLALIDAPVLGTRQPAEQGELIALVAGPDDAIERSAPAFEAIAKRTVQLGEVGEATRLKLVINHWILGIVENVAETVLLAEGLGVDPRRWLSTIEGGPLDLPYAQTKGAAILDRAFEPSFRLALARKDARLVLDAAERHDVEAALMRVVEQRMASAIEAGHGDEDMAATYFAGGSGAR